MSEIYRTNERRRKKVQKNKVINFCHNMFREMNNWKEIYEIYNMQNKDICIRQCNWAKPVLNKYR